MRDDTALLLATSRNELHTQVATIIDGLDVSDSTRSQYQRDVRRLLAWLAGRTLHPNVLLDWKRYLQRRGDLATGTQAKYLAVARALFRELYRLQLLPVDVTTGVKGLKVTRAHKRTALNDAEVECVFSYLHSADADPRARVIIGLMFYQGLRRIEVARLRVEHFDASAKTLSVLGKGRDDYETIDLHPKMVAILAAYLTANSLRSGPLLPSRKVPGAGLTSNAIWRVAIAVHRKLGIGEKNLHSWRKTFTTRLIQRSGMNLLEVQGYTRHASLQMLQVYYQRLEKAKTLSAYYAAFPI